ncbi:hypothetical protein [Nonomuraea angiospora]|uniref:hypothetical protein n=1 Tax=Nonomuraea angiospora TaxID=46172 RepID=UPI0029BEBBB5|nr:hypothetical protein [Nonomuraea angiospora]MDX3110765.1 hypothetical protein [Nonomuraea angiospora]
MTSDKPRPSPIIVTATCRPSSRAGHMGPTWLPRALPDTSRAGADSPSTPIEPRAVRRHPSTPIERRAVRRHPSTPDSTGNPNLAPFVIMALGHLLTSYHELRLNRRPETRSHLPRTRA